MNEKLRFIDDQSKSKTLDLIMIAIAQQISNNIKALATFQNKDVLFSTARKAIEWKELDILRWLNLFDERKIKSFYGIPNTITIWDWESIDIDLFELTWIKPISEKIKQLSYDDKFKIIKSCGAFEWKRFLLKTLFWNITLKQIHSIIDQSSDKNHVIFMINEILQLPESLSIDSLSLNNMDTLWSMNHIYDRLKRFINLDSKTTSSTDLEFGDICMGIILELTNDQNIKHIIQILLEKDQSFELLIHKTLGFWNELLSKINLCWLFGIWKIDIEINKLNVIDKLILVWQVWTIKWRKLVFDILINSFWKADFVLALSDDLNKNNCLKSIISIFWLPNKYSIAIATWNQEIENVDMNSLGSEFEKSLQNIELTNFDIIDDEKLKWLNDNHRFRIVKQAETLIWRRLLIKIIFWDSFNISIITNILKNSWQKKEDEFLIKEILWIPNHIQLYKMLCWSVIDKKPSEKLNELKQIDIFEWRRIMFILYFKEHVKINYNPILDFIVLNWLILANTSNAINDNFNYLKWTKDLENEKKKLEKSIIKFQETKDRIEELWEIILTTRKIFNIINSTNPTTLKILNFLFENYVFTKIGSLWIENINDIILKWKFENIEYITKFFAKPNSKIPIKNLNAKYIVELCSVNLDLLKIIVNWLWITDLSEFEWCTDLFNIVEVWREVDELNPYLTIEELAQYYKIPKDTKIDWKKITEISQIKKWVTDPTRYDENKLRQERFERIKVAFDIPFKDKSLTTYNTAWIKFLLKYASMDILKMIANYHKKDSNALLIKMLLAIKDYMETQFKHTTSSSSGYWETSERQDAQNRLERDVLDIIRNITFKDFESYEFDNKIMRKLITIWRAEAIWLFVIDFVRINYTNKVWELSWKSNITDSDKKDRIAETLFVWSLLAVYQTYHTKEFFDPNISISDIIRHHIRKSWDDTRKWAAMKTVNNASDRALRGK